jgi:hypothetical protein
MTIGSRRHEIELSAPAAGAHKPSVPIDDGRLGAVALDYFAGI